MSISNPEANGIADAPDFVAIVIEQSGRTVAAVENLDRCEEWRLVVIVFGADAASNVSRHRLLLDEIRPAQVA
jgi:hypothetical protein